MIIGARLKPRERLSDQEIAKQLGISRTPVREALNKLAAEGLVVMDQRGTAVADLNMAYMVDIYQTRAALEGFAARLAAPHITEEDVLEMRRYLDKQSACTIGTEALLARTGTQFHLVLLNRAGNKVLLNAVRQLMDECERFRASTHYAAVMKEFIMDAHEEIIEVAERRQPDLLELTVRTHLLEVAQRIGHLDQRIRKEG